MDLGPLGPVFQHGNEQAGVVGIVANFQLVSNLGEELFKQGPERRLFSLFSQQAQSFAYTLAGKGTEAGEGPIFGRAPDIVQLPCQIFQHPPGIIIAHAQIPGGDRGLKIHDGPQGFGRLQHPDPYILVFGQTEDSRSEDSHRYDVSMTPGDQHMHGAVVIESAVDKRAAADAGRLKAGKSGAGHNIGEKELGRHLVFEYLHRLQIPDGNGDQTEIHRAFQQPLDIHQLGEQFLHPAGVHAAILPHLAKSVFVIGKVRRIHLSGEKLLITDIVDVKKIFIG